MERGRPDSPRRRHRARSAAARQGTCPQGKHAEAHHRPPEPRPKGYSRRAREGGRGDAAANKRSARTPSAKRLRDSAFADALHSPRTAPLNLGGAPRRQGGQARPQGRTACSRRRLHAAAARASASERRRADNIIGRRLVRSAYLSSAEREL